MGLADDAKDIAADVAATIREKIADADEAVRDRVEQLIAAGELAAAELEADRAASTLDRATERAERHAEERKES